MMSSKGLSRRFKLLLACLPLVLALAFLPGQTESIDLGPSSDGHWLVTNRSADYAGTCAAGDTCVEWCIDEGPDAGPTGIFCCLADHLIANHRYPDCTNGWMIP